MSVIEIAGPWPALAGSAVVAGAKNSAMPALVAAALAPGRVAVRDVPRITDLATLAELLCRLGVDLRIDASIVRVGPRAAVEETVPADLATRFRGAVYGLALPAVVFGRARCGPIGGDRLSGASLRRTALAPHVRAFAGLGMTLGRSGDGWVVDGGPPVAGEFTLDDDGVSASALAVLLAACADGRSVIHEASLEVEVDDTLDAVRTLGAGAQRIGRTLIVTGPMSDAPAILSIPPDRIHAGTIAIAAAVTGGAVTLPGQVASRMDATFAALSHFGVDIVAEPCGGVRVAGPATRAARVATAMYPGFPTDLLPPLTVLAAQAPGRSMLDERVYDSRSGHVESLRALGATIGLTGGRLVVDGPTRWRAAAVRGDGIRETAAIVLAALVTPGWTRIEDAAALARGYDGLLDALATLGRGGAAPGPGSATLGRGGADRSHGADSLPSRSTASVSLSSGVVSEILKKPSPLGP